MVTADWIQVDSDLFCLKPFSLLYFKAKCCISKQIDFFQQVLVLGWVYLAMEGIVSLAGLTESYNLK
jgi:hypothetical protein